MTAIPLNPSTMLVLIERACQLEGTAKPTPSELALAQLGYRVLDYLAHMREAYATPGYDLGLVNAALDQLAAAVGLAFFGGAPLPNAGWLAGLVARRLRAKRELVAQGDEQLSASAEGADVETRISRLVANRVLPSVRLTFRRYQNGNLEVSAVCSGCQTDLGVLLRVPIRDLVVSPEVLDHIADRIVERVNELHCKFLRGGAGRQVVHAASAPDELHH